MRRRILVAILGTVALSLLLAGAGTYVLLARQAARTTEANLRDEAAGLADLVAVTPRASTGRVTGNRVVRGLRLEGISVVVIAPTGEIRGTLPEGVEAVDLDVDALRAGTTVSGRRGTRTWAAAATSQGRASVAVVLTRSADRPAPPVSWFLLAGGVALAIGAAVATGLSGSLTRPLREAQVATGRIAAGDLSARLPDPAVSADDEVADLTRSINVMASSLEEARGLERQFLLSVSHDLRTPLTSIQGYAEAIGDGTASDATAAAAVIRSEATRLERLVRDLLDLARLDARAFSIRMAQVPVSEVVVDTAEGFRPAAEAVGIALEVHADHPGLVARVDADRLAQSLANLIENALKYAISQLWIVVAPSPTGGTMIEIVDDGPGIDPEDLAHLFDRLYTSGRRAARGGEGTGLGLALTRELIGAMDGTVDVASPALAIGGGARFVVWLPESHP